MPCARAFGGKEMHRTVAMLIAALILSGCLSGPMDGELKGLVGQKISKAQARLGYSDGRRTVENGTIYVWSSTHNVTTSGMVGDIPVQGMTSAPSYTRANDTCTVQIVADLHDIITSYQWSGNQHICARYSSALAS